MTHPLFSLGLVSLFLAPTLCLPSRAAGDADGFLLREAVECHPRSGLPHFRSKVDAGETVKIAYLGGSITAAPGWRVQSREWFADQYPDASFEEIFAAIGGTGSDLGVFRLQNDVLRHDPDLLFVEFAVNDGGASPERIQKAMEGIVRQAWKSDPSIDICFVYTVSEPVMPDLREGKMQRSASAMEALADRYEIPSIHFGVEVAAMERRDELVFKAPKPEKAAEAKPVVFSTDGVHPHVETGHRVYTETIARSWPAIRNASGQPVHHKVGDPLRPDNWEGAKQVPITSAMLKGDWETLPGDHPIGKRFARNMPNLFQAKSPGAVLEFSFVGTTASVFDLLGPDGGVLSVQVDDLDATRSQRIDGYCTYHRMSKLAVMTEGEKARHSVRITLTDEILDKREILFEKNRPRFDENPKRFAGHNWYAASLLIIGDLVEE